MLINIVLSSNNIARHYTIEKDKLSILKNGFKPSKSGWLGPGLYAHTGNGTEGKGTAFVEFDYSTLKLCTSDWPPELSDKEIQKLMVKDYRTINKKLAKLGYDGYLADHKGWILVFPESINKIKPIRVT